MSNTRGRSSSPWKNPHDESGTRPVSYAGTQLNFFTGQEMPQEGGNSALTSQMKTYPYGYAYPPSGFTNNVQLGLVTDHMLRKLDESRMLTMTELMRRTTGSAGAAPKGLAYPPTAALSPGGGDWEGQIDHVAAHLREIAGEDGRFRKSLAQPQLGLITSADLDEGEQSYILTLKFDKPRMGGGGECVRVEAPSQAPVEGGRRVASEPRENIRRVEAKVKSHREPEEPEYEKENYPQEGTLKPARAFNAEDDANALRQAMKGLGTDESAISAILGARSSKQRQEIMKTYKSLLGKDLVKDLKGELSGDFWKVIRALLYTPADYDATMLRNAIKGFGTDNDCVIEIICTRTNKTIGQIKDAYKRLYNRSLEEDIEGDTSGHFQRLLLSLLQGRREEDSKVDRRRAAAEAEALHQAGPRKWGTDESKFNAILVNRSPAQLRATFAEYEQLSGQHIDDTIKSEVSGDLAAGLLTIVRCINDKPRYFARQLYKAMKGMGTDDDALVRIIVSRAEVDMVQIKDVFQSDYQQSLGQFIAADTSGDFAKILLILVGSSRSASVHTTSSHRRDRDEEDESDY